MTRPQVWGRLPDGTEVLRVTLEGGGLRARFLTWGAVLQDLRLEGHAAPLVLGLESLAAYLDGAPYFGATVGRCANRIALGRFPLDGRTVQLDVNHGRHHLHGGREGTGRLPWRLAGHDACSLRLALDLPDGHMGYPGRLAIAAEVWLLEGAVLDIRYEAETDTPTLCNLAHHSYFTLQEGGIGGHRLRIAAETYLPTDAEALPAGDPAPVAGTPLDFRSSRPIGTGSRIDHNFCLAGARRDIVPVAWLHGPDSGLTLECRTTEPGLQVFDGHTLGAGGRGLDGQPLGAHAGLALEPQVWPDSPNRPGFPPAVLRPGALYRQHTQFAFSRSLPET